MSFLLRRNLPRAWAGWRDTFNRANESPIQKPWGVWGAQPCTAQIESNVLRFGAGSAWTNFGGWSFEHQPFTKTWGIQFQMSCASRAVAEKIDICLSSPWSKVGPSINNVLSVAIQYRPSIFGITPRVMILGYANAAAVGDIYAEAPLPASAFNSTMRTYRIRVYGDSFVKVYYEGSEICSAPIPAAFRTGVNKRAANFLNAITTNVFVDNFELYDRPGQPDSGDWTSQFYDTFNRPDSVTVDNGWTKVGTNSGVSGSAYATTGTTDGSRGIYQSTPLPSGNMRLETVWGGPGSPSTGQCSSIIGRMNSAGTAGIAANVFRNKIYIAKFTGTLTAPVFADIAESITLPTNLVNGDKTALCIVGDEAWVENSTGAILAFAEGANAASPDSNHYFGARVQRGAFINSQSFNDYRALTA
jgi:hypothetical protein